jgi:hypothetical protein
MTQKNDLPDLYVSESIMYKELKELGLTRSTTGNITFTSSSSTTTYNSTTGQLGIMQQLETLLTSYKINADDWNMVVDNWNTVNINQLLNDDIKATIQTPTYTDGKITQVVHKDVSDNTIRTDTFTYTAAKITEVRTLHTAETLTLEYYFDVDGTYNRTEVS